MVPYHEDTVTQSMALHLNRWHPGENRVHVFGRIAEEKNGSDFSGFFDHFPISPEQPRSPIALLLPQLSFPPQSWILIDRP